MVQMFSRNMTTIAQEKQRRHEREKARRSSEMSVRKIEETWKGDREWMRLVRS